MNIASTHDKLILIGLGANLPGADGASPIETLDAALVELERLGVGVVRRSRWFRSAPVPKSEQSWYFNGVAVVAFDDQPQNLLKIMQRVEKKFGRIRRTRNEARILDLDILAFGDLVLVTSETSATPGLALPHPELQKRAFVLVPMADVVVNWRHPVSRQSLDEMIACLPPGQLIEPLIEPEIDPAKIESPDVQLC